MMHIINHEYPRTSARSKTTLMRGTLYAAAAVSSLAFATATAAPTDFTGPWEVANPPKELKTLNGDRPPLTTEGQALLKRNQADPDGDPLKRCLPLGVPRAMMQAGFPFSIIAGKTLTGIMIQWNHLPRVVYMNREHFDNIGPTYLGQSVGHWDGTTLIVDTTGFNDKTWLDESGLPHSDALHTVERIRLKDANTLEDKITFDDAKVFSKPWTTTLHFKKRADAIIKEDYCFGRMGIDVAVK